MRLPRSSGVLLHPTSLPGPHGSGDCGADAVRFVDWLVSAGQSLWQVLPLGGIGPGNSPYASPSAFAGNVLLVDLVELKQQGWLDDSEIEPVPGLVAERVDFGAVVPYRMQRLAIAAQRFFAQGGDAATSAYAAFCDDHRGWLDDYALFMALSEAQDWRAWCDWEPALAFREPQAIERAAADHAERVRFWKFAQWSFFRQWAALRTYARERGVRIVGDMPIFVAHHSADVWAEPGLFELGEDGRSTVVAGVPPDYFSATGQRWGNPLYRWDAHRADGYGWWIRRMRGTFEMVDIVRIDHFRGFAGYWEIPASEPTAVHGRWMPGPGADLFEAVEAALGRMPIIAEDLGLITPDVDELRRRIGCPGMGVLQFAFGGDASNPFLPHHHAPDRVIYPGTHDNDTCIGWWATATEHERGFARAYLATDGHDMAWSMIRAACASVADTAIIAMQDVLTLDGSSRMNFPGQDGGWWEWRLQWAQVQSWHAQRLAMLCGLYDRKPPRPPG